MVVSVYFLDNSAGYELVRSASAENVARLGASTLAELEIEGDSISTDTSESSVRHEPTHSSE